MNLKLLHRFGALVLLCLACSIAPAAAQGVGGIGGTIADKSGAVLPGATVTLASPRGTIGSNQAAVTDERGTFQFTRLVPGAYNVKAELAGFTLPFKRTSSSALTSPRASTSGSKLAVSPKTLP